MPVEQCVCTDGLDVQRYQSVDTPDSSFLCYRRVGYHWEKQLAVEDDFVGAGGQVTGAWVANVPEPSPSDVFDNDPAWVGVPRVRITQCGVYLITQNSKTGYFPGFVGNRPEINRAWNQIIVDGVTVAGTDTFDALFPELYDEPNGEGINLSSSIAVRLDVGSIVEWRYAITAQGDPGTWKPDIDAMGGITRIAGC